MAVGLFDPYLYSRLRARLAPDDIFQAIAGPLEHREFAREAVAGNPLSALSLGLAVPAYTAAKAAGLLKTRSPASLDEIFAGYQGIGQGLRDWGEGLFSRLNPPPQNVLLGARG